MWKPCECVLADERTKSAVHTALLHTQTSMSPPEPACSHPRTAVNMNHPAGIFSARPTSPVEMLAIESHVDEC